MNIIEKSIAGLVIPSIVERSLNKGQHAVYDCIQQNPGYKVLKISADTGIPSKSIERHIAYLIDRQLIEHRRS